MSTDIKCSSADSRGIDTVSQLSNIVDIVRWRATCQGNETAFRFLQNGEDETIAMNYGELDEEVRRLAGRLQECDLEGERVLLVLPTGPDYIISMLACLYAGSVAVPSSPPRPNRHSHRLETVSRNASPRAVLTTARVRDSLGSQLEDLSQQFDCRVLTTDESQQASQTTWRPRVPRPESVAYLQYTSGATRHPKGVMITHGNLLHSCRAIGSVVGECEQHLGVSWLPFSHDMGLVGALFFPITLGFPLVFMAPEAFVMRPVRWLRAITRYRATLSPAPNFAYDLCVDRITPEQRSELDLSSWRIAFNGSERIDYQSLRRFTDVFSPCGFLPETCLPCYGLAEATLMVTSGLADEQPKMRRLQRSALDASDARPDNEGVAIVSCGRPVEDTEVVIVDPETRRRCPSGRVGEIWISGPSVADGYWDNPELTATTFEAREAKTGEGLFLRTGDLGFEQDGELFITGRLKDLIIIEGRNIYPEDIETTVENAEPAISPGSSIAFAVNDGPSERLVVVAGVDRVRDGQIDVRSLERTVLKAVAMNNDIPLSELVLINRRELPKTASGKKQRSACRTAFIEGSINRLFTATQLDETTLRTWMQRRVAREFGVSEDEIDPGDQLMSLGIDSLALVGMAGELAELIGRDVPAEILWEHDTITSLARYLASQGDQSAGDAEFAGGSRLSTLQNPYFANAGHWSPVRAIQPGGDRLPLFLVHGVDGLAVYRQLARSLGEHQPTYGLQQPPEPPATVEEMADILIDGLRTVQRKGPYHLGAYCFGGVIAFEMARQLDAMGERVALLAMFDTPAPRKTLQRLVYDKVAQVSAATSTLIHGPIYLARELVNDPQEVAARVGRRLRRWSHRLRHRIGFTEEPRLEHYVFELYGSKSDVRLNNIAALRNYCPKSYSGCLTLFQSAEFRCFHGTIPWQWRKLTEGGINLCQIPGNHKGMLSAPAVEYVAERLRSRLHDLPLR